MSINTEKPKQLGRWLFLILPFLPLVLLFSVFYNQLNHGSGDAIPSALLGKKVPEFSLAALTNTSLSGAQGFSNMQLSNGHVTVLNVFASWCAPCHDEHPLLMALAQIPIFRDGTFILAGLAYKDTSAHVEQFLTKDGNPYHHIGLDGDGRVGLDFGVYGVPETFVITGDGIIIARFVGPLTPELVTTKLAEALAKAKAHMQAQNPSKSQP